MKPGIGPLFFPGRQEQDQGMKKMLFLAAMAALAAALNLEGCSHATTGQGLWTYVDVPDSRRPVQSRPAFGEERFASPGGLLMEEGSWIPARFIRIAEDRDLGMYVWPAGDYEVIGSSPDDMIGWRRVLAVSAVGTGGQRIMTREPRRFPLPEDGKIAITYSAGLPLARQEGGIFCPSRNFLASWGGKIAFGKALHEGRLPDPRGSLRRLEYLGREGDGVRVRFSERIGRGEEKHEEAVLKPDAEGICSFHGARFKILGFSGGGMQFVPLRGTGGA